MFTDCNLKRIWMPSNSYTNPSTPPLFKSGSLVFFFLFLIIYGRCVRLVIFFLCKIITTCILLICNITIQYIVYTVFVCHRSNPNIAFYLIWDMLLTFLARRGCLAMFQGPQFSWVIYFRYKLFIVWNFVIPVMTQSKSCLTMKRTNGNVVILLIYKCIYWRV